VCSPGVVLFLGGPVQFPDWFLTSEIDQAGRGAVRGFCSSSIIPFILALRFEWMGQRRTTAYGSSFFIPTAPSEDGGEISPPLPVA
jgi:hypothetical protein